MELSDDRVVEVLDPGKVLAHVVGRPTGPELVATGGQLTDQVRQCAVVRVTASSSVQDRYGFVGRPVPVEIKGAGAVVEEDEPGVVGRTCRVVVNIAIQGVAELIGGEDVQAPVDDKCR